MKNKYYTPTIDEFCFGFEYEWREGDDETTPWIKAICDYNMLPVTEESRERNQYRVKYLNREDVEELGWEFIKKDEYGSDVFYKNIETGPKKGVKYYIHVPSNTPRIFIKWESYFSYGSYKGEMGVNIKNKNEFEKLFNKHIK